MNRISLALGCALLALASTAHAQSASAPASSAPARTEATQAKNNFGGSLAAVTDEDWQQKWETPPETKPDFNKADVVPYGKKVFVLIFFSNPKLDSHGKANVRCDLKLTNPDGKVTFSQKDAECFAGKVKGQANDLYLSKPVVSFSGDPSDPAGTWIVEVKLRDALRKVELPLRTSFQLK